MTPEQMVTRLRAAAKAGREGPRRWYGSGDLPPTPLVEDEAPVPSLAELCRCNDGMPCGEDTCVCGEPIRRFASSWWHTHGRRDHHATPAVKEKP